METQKSEANFKNLFGKNEPTESNKMTPDMVHKILEKTFWYSMDSIKVNDDGTTSHLHSPEFLEKHPERRNNPEFTEEEELEQMKYIAYLAQIS